MAATASSDHRSGHNPPEAQESTSEVLESEICDDNVLRKLRTFDVKSSDAQITQAVMDLRAYEDELREQYERLFLNLKHWVNTGLSFEFERAHDMSVPTVHASILLTDTD